MSTGLSPRKYQNEYDKWFGKELIAYKNNMGFRDISLRKFAEQYCFYVTMTFSRDRIRKRESRQSDTTFRTGSIELSNFHFFYNTIRRQLFGKNYYRNSKSNLFALACLDAEGTKYGSCNTINNKFENIHVHAIVVPSFGYTKNFIEYINSTDFQRLKYNCLDCDDIQIKPVNVPDSKSDTHALQGIISYTTKLMRQNFVTGEIEEDYLIYPKSLHPNTEPQASRPKLKAMHWAPNNQNFKNTNVPDIHF
jgi:hypothetical protein